MWSKEHFLSVTHEHDAARDWSLVIGIWTMELTQIMRRLRYLHTTDFPDTDIRDKQTLSNTQREDWLLPTEPLHGARPR